MAKRKTGGRKRAPGGGRKPMGDFSGLTAVMSLRLSAEMRARLDTAARKTSRRLKRKWGISQELLRRVQGSFERERDEARDPALRAFFFLFSELVPVICFNLSPRPN